MGEVSVQFLGCGGRFQTCVHVQFDTTHFLIDCGASTLITMKRYGLEPSLVDIILLTHLHGDHFGGLPFSIMEAQYVSHRRKPLVVAGPPGLENRMNEAMEALNNRRKHAQASQVVMTLSYMNNLVAPNVQDDGVGFNPDRLPTTEPSAQSTGGFGLRGMRERVEQLRGTLLHESAPGEGSTLMVAIPVAAGKQVAGEPEALKETP